MLFGVGTTLINKLNIFKNAFLWAFFINKLPLFLQKCLKCVSMFVIGCVSVPLMLKWVILLLFKKITALVVTAFAVSVLSSYGCAAVGGSASWIAVSTKEQLDAVRKKLNANYYLANDIVFTPEDFAPGGEFYNKSRGFTPIGTGNNPFKGTFDGNGHTVYGLVTYSYGAAVSSSGDGWSGDYSGGRPSSETIDPAAGLFGFNSGEIMNLSVANCNIMAKSTNTAPMFAGAVSGYNSGTIENCFAYGNVQCNALDYSGGIVGYQNSGSVKNCAFFGNVKSEKCAGGIVGYVFSGNVENCYTHADFCRCSGTAETDRICVASDGSNVINCYYACNRACDGNGIWISPSDHVAKGNYPGLDFLNIWEISSEFNMPLLKNLNVFNSLKPEQLHDFGEWEVLTESTCTKQGIMKRVCKFCNFGQMQQLEYSDHIWNDDWTLDVAPTINSPGSKSHHCKNCSAKTDITSVPLLEDYLPGDADSNGMVELSDVVTIARYIAGWQIKIDLNAANVNNDYDDSGNALITLEDVVYLARHIAGWCGFDLIKS